MIERLESLRRSGLLDEQTFVQFDKLTELAAAIIGAPVSLMSMVDEDRQYFTSHFGLSEPLANARQTPLSQSVCSTVVSTGTALAIGDMGGDDRFEQHPSRQDLSVEAYCGVPIRDPDGHVLGSFCVIDDKPRQWKPADIQLLESFAAIVGDYIRTSHEHHTLVTGLQERLLPSTAPVTTAGTIQGRYRPVESTLAIGGDFYDWNVRSDATIDLVLGDVVGHGLEPAQAAAQLRAAARAVFFGSTQAADAAVRRMSASCAGLPGCAYAAVTVVRIEADGGTVQWARAGSLPPILVDRDGARILDGESAPPLGVGTCTERHVARQHLAPGDTILFFTDGLVERRGETIDEGFERARRSCERSIVVDSIIDDVGHGGERLDDVAVLAFTRAATS